MEHLESVEVDSVADLTVLVNVDESTATEVEVAQHALGPWQGPAWIH